MKIKTADLIGPALDWAVAKVWYGPEYDMSIPLFDDGLIFQPSALWQHGGPIIEREQITVEYQGWGGEDQWIGYIRHDEEIAGPTPLIAAMRCFVASKLGEEIDIPEGLE